MEPLTIRIQPETKESLEAEAAEYDVSVSEYVRRLIDKGREYDELAERLESREARIDELESQLARRSEIEEKVEALPDKIREVESEPAPPWPVRWYRWVRRDRDD
jgi:chromosome segregation ATPase